MPYLNYKYRRDTPKIIIWLIENSAGLIRTEKQAVGFLLVLAFLIMIASFVIIKTVVSPPPIENNFEILPFESVGSPQGLPPN